MTDGLGNWISHNGEIYNFKALRTALAGRGHCFRTESDTEVILAVYREWGVEGFDRLRGIYAFALYDKKRRKLLLARDPIGIKPLFLDERDGKGRFASDLDTLRALGPAPPDLSARGIRSYLLVRFVPATNSVYHRCRAVLPGEVVELSDSGQRQRRSPFLALPAVDRPGDESDLEEFRALLRERVLEQTVSDVPIGVLLSSGLDSASVACCLAQAGVEVTAFTLDYDEGLGAGSRHQESSVAGRLAQKWGMCHQVRRIGANDIADLVERVPARIDSPFGGPGLLSYDRLADFVCRKVKVVLGGDGPDEMFGGYRRHRLPLWPSPLRRAAGLVGRLGQGALGANQARFVLDRLRMLNELWRRRHPPPNRFPQAPWLTVFDKEEAETIFCPSLAPAWDWWDDPVNWRCFAPALGDCVNSYLATDVRLEMVDNVLTKVDRMSMAYSLEVRVPLLDPDIVRFSFALPGRRKVGMLSGKNFFREAVAPWLPQEILRRSKRGFAPPVDEWLRSDLGTRLAQRVEGPLQSLLGVRPQGVRAMIEQHRSRKADHTYPLWALHALSVWLEERPCLGLAA